MHSIQDYYAHSYVVSIAYYKKHFKEYKDDSAAVIYHNDRERIKNNAGKVVELKDRAPNVHKKTKTMKTLRKYSSQSEIAPWIPLFEENEQSFQSGSSISKSLFCQYPRNCGRNINGG